MSIKRRIFISSPRDKQIIEQCSIDLKWAIINEVERLGYEPQVFGSKGGRGLAAGKS